MRMFDRHHRKIIWSKDAKSRRIRQMMLRKLKMVDISNVAQYFSEYYDHKVWDWPRDFPNLAPPWHFAWYEYGFQRMPRSRALIHEGALVQAIELPKDRREYSDLQHETLSWLKFRGPGLEIVSGFDPKREELLQTEREQGIVARWLLTWDFYVSIGRDCSHWFTALQYLQETGQPCNPELNIYLRPTGSPVAAMYEPDEARRRLEDKLLPFAFAISLLNCKNTEIVEIPRSKKGRKRAAKKGLADVVYRQLVVHPMRPRRRYMDDEEGEDRELHEPTVRLHIQRGHFKDYRFGKGLFGKYKDIYWWDQHVRGNEDVGVLCKTYRVMDA